MSTRLQKNYTLFIHPKSRGSQKCVDCINDSMFKDKVNLINIANIPANKKPSFIDGVPILANHQTRQLFKGRECIQEIFDLCKDNKLFSLAPTNQNNFVHSFDGQRRISTAYQPLDLSQTLGKKSYECESKSKDLKEYQKRRDKYNEQILQKQSAIRIGMD